MRFFLSEDPFYRNPRGIKYLVGVCFYLFGFNQKIQLPFIGLRADQKIVQSAIEYCIGFDSLNLYPCHIAFDQELIECHLPPFRAVAPAALGYFRDIFSCPEVCS